MNNTVKTFKTLKELKKFLKEVYNLPHNLNRPIEGANVNKIRESLQAIGVQREINLIKTALFGKLAYYIIDGQHLVEAILSLDEVNGALSVRINTVETKDDIIRMASYLNSTGKKWTLSNYLNAWIASGKKEYKLIKDTAEDLNVTLNPVIEMFSKYNDNTMFKEGRFVADKGKANDILSVYNSAVEEGVLKGSSTLGAIVRLYTMYKETASDITEVLTKFPESFQQRMGRDEFIRTYKQLKKSL